MNKSESDQEDNDDINDNDWSYGSEKKGGTGWGGGGTCCGAPSLCAGGGHGCCPGSVGWRVAFWAKFGQEK